MPRRQTHPDRLAAMAQLFGMRPAPVTACRVLELGCGDGANPIPAAGAIIEVRYLYAYPGGSLYQPVYLCRRDDVALSACTLAQLKYKAVSGDADDT